MQTTEGMKIRLSMHAMKTAVQKGFTPEIIDQTFASPSKVYASKSHPGQFRVTGNGLCLVGKPEGKTFACVTMYADRVITPPRADQMNTEVGRRYAERYAQGLGRG